MKFACWAHKQADGRCTDRRLSSPVKRVAIAACMTKGNAVWECKVKKKKVRREEGGKGGDWLHMGEEEEAEG